MRTTQHARTTVRLGIATAVAAGTILGGSLAGAQPAAADPIPPIPHAGAKAAVSIPSKFTIAPMSLGRKDDPALGSYRPVAMTQLLLRRWTSNLAVDGSFGYATRAAVQKFQRAEGLAATGTLQRADFYRLFVRQAVKYGSTGDAVRAAQIWLTRDPSHHIVVDGSFGPATRTAVLDEQRTHGSCHGTGPDGIVGPLTRAMSYEYEHEGPC